MKKILIIEDDPIVGHIYRSRLEKEGFQVELAADGQSGYYRLHELKPDVLLLDLMLPKMNGIELLRKIRAMREFEKLPVLVFTNAYVANMINEAFTAGATAVYNKSNVTPRQVIDVLNTMATGAHAGTAGTDVTAASTSSASLIKSSDDDAFQSELLREFLSSNAARLTEMRKNLQEISKSSDSAVRGSKVEQLYRNIRTFAASAAMCGLPHVGKLAAATEALIKELLEKPASVTASTLRTAAHAIDCLDECTQANLPCDLADNPPIQILVVDDEMLSRRAIVYALEKAYLKPMAVEKPEEALKHTATSSFDLIFLDVHMPGMDGFQLCQKLREHALNVATPVVFVTSSADFPAKAQSTLHRASDLIAKPFMFIELTVKALTFALRYRLEKLKRGTAKVAAPAPSPEPAEIIM